jgi:hypothetical protein
MSGTISEFDDRSVSIPQLNQYNVNHPDLTPHSQSKSHNPKRPTSQIDID